jgi:hypothetical protein
MEHDRREGEHSHTSTSKLKSTYVKQMTPRVETDSSDSEDKLQRGNAKTRAGEEHHHQTAP